MKTGTKVRIKPGYNFGGSIATVSSIREKTIMVYFDNMEGCNPRCVHPYGLEQVVEIKQIKLKKFSAWK